MAAVRLYPDHCRSPTEVAVQSGPSDRVQKAEGQAKSEGFGKGQKEGPGRDPGRSPLPGNPLSFHRFRMVNLPHINERKKAVELDKEPGRPHSVNQQISPIP